MRSGRLTANDARATLLRHPAMPRSRVRPIGRSSIRVWELRDSVSAYDAAYIALAESLGVPLLTCDARLGRAHGHSAEVVVYPSELTRQRVGVHRRRAVEHRPRREPARRRELAVHRAVRSCSPASDS